MDFADPEKNIKQFCLREGQLVADFGAGSGMYTFAAADEVGTTGDVYAIEVQKDLVTRVLTEAQHRGLKNVNARWGDIEVLQGSKLRTNIFDAVIVSNVLFQVADKKGLLEELKRVLKQGGRVLVVDWDSSYNGLGPHEESIVREHDARSLFAHGGFVFEGSIQAGTHHYGFSVAKI